MRVGRISTIQQLQLPASAGSLPRLAALLSRSQAAGSSAAGASACGIAWPAAAVSAPAAHSAASSSTGAACGHRSPHREHYLCCSGWPQRSAGSPLPLVAGPTCGKGCHVCLLAWPLPTAESLPPPPLCTAAVPLPGAPHRERLQQGAPPGWIARTSARGPFSRQGLAAGRGHTWRVPTARAAPSPNPSSLLLSPRQHRSEPIFTHPLSRPAPPSRAPGGAQAPLHVQDQPPPAIPVQAGQVHGGQGGQAGGAGGHHHRRHPPVRGAALRGGV